jgi:predicted nucleic acid-binding protein
VAPRALGRPVITLDTSALYALLNRRDRAHTAAVQALKDDPGPYLVPAATLGEIAFLVEERLGIGVLDLLLADLESGAYTLDCGEADLGGARQLVQRYADLSLGYVDAAVIACAERSGGRVLTFDLRDFGVVAAEGTITILPAPPQ